MVIGAVCCFKITKYNNSDKFIIEPSLNGIKNIALSAVLSDNFEITDTDLNGVISWWLENSDNNGNLKSAAVYFNDENKVEIYGSFIYLDRELTFSANGTVSFFKDSICFETEDFNVGDLNIPTQLAMYFIKSQLPSNVSYDENKLLLPSKYDLDIFGTDYVLCINEISCQNGKCLIVHT